MKPISKKTLRKPIFSFSLFAICVILLSMEYMERKQRQVNLQPKVLSTEVTTPQVQESDSTMETEFTLDSVAQLELPACTDEDIIITHAGFTLSYNNEWHLPEWVAYELTAEETTGTVERSDHFRPDPLSPQPQITTDDYRNSGYDRGHMAPAADMKWSEDAMRESFYMTNICPQNHNLNAGDWKELEELCRRWATEYGRIYIVCGPIVGSDAQFIGNNQVTVPHAFFKAILTYNNQTPQAIGFLFANKAGNRPVQTYAMNIDDLEVVIGHDLFHLLPDTVENNIEQSTQINQWTW